MYTIHIGFGIGSDHRSHAGIGFETNQELHCMYLLHNMSADRFG